MKKIFLFLAGFVMGLIIFMPKDNLYYTFQDYLKKEKIYINSDIKSGISLDLKNGVVYYNGMDILNFKDINIFPFIFYNEIKAKNINLNMGNYKINSIKIIYSIFYPVKIFVKGKSNFGQLNGNINLIKREIKVYILNLTDNSLKRFLRKDKKGYFYYAKF
jgi:hypothetical protein